MKPFRPMLGHLLARVIFVEGPGAAAFTATDRLDVLMEVMHGVGRLRRLAESWGARQAVPIARVCGFTVDWRSVSVDLDPGSLPAPTLSVKEPIDAEFDKIDAVWIDAALTALGHPPPPGPDRKLADRVSALTPELVASSFFGLDVADAFPIAVTKYNSYWLAYNKPIGWITLAWPRLTTNSFTSNKLDRVVAHEVGHMFGAPDEAAHCTVAQKAGPFAAPNANCVFLSDQTSNPATVDCLMKLSSETLCASTEMHWGWRDADQDGITDLVAAPTVTSVEPRAGTPGDRVTIRGRNLWDADVVVFGTAPSPMVDPVGPDEVRAVVPDDAFGIVTVRVVTRGGASASPLIDTWFLAAPVAVPTGITQPMVFGVVPGSGRPGTRVTILGANFLHVAKVTFGGIEADISQLDPFSETLDSEMELDAPSGAAGPVEVQVVTDAGSSLPFTPFSTFTYT
jgi:hypothetical protein